MCSVGSTNHPNTLSTKIMQSEVFMATYVWLIVMRNSHQLAWSYAGEVF